MPRQPHSHQTPFDVPPRTAILSNGVATSVVARQGKHRAAQFAAARTIRRDVRHGSASNHSRIRADTATNGSGRRRPRGAFASSCWSVALRRPARPCAAREGIAPSSARGRRWLRPHSGRSAISTSSCWAAGSSATTDRVQGGIDRHHLAPNFLAGSRIRQQPLIRRGRGMIASS